MSERPETEADLGTFPDGDLGFSGVSSWCGIRRDAPLRNDGLVPVLLLRRRIRRRLEIIPSVRDTDMCEHSASVMHNRSRGQLLPSSSAGMETRGVMSKLWVLFMTSGLALRSEWEELDEARGRRLQEKQREQVLRISVVIHVYRNFTNETSGTKTSQLLRDLNKERS